MGTIRTCIKLPVAVELKASSILETIVASIIFLVVFAMSIEILSRLTLTGVEPYTLVDINHNIEICLGRYSDGTYAQGVYRSQYNWGEINTTISAYDRFDKLQLISVVAVVAKNNKRIELQQIGKKKP